MCITAESVYMWVTPVCVYVKRAELSIYTHFYTHFIRNQIDKFHPLRGRFPLMSAEEILVQSEAEVPALELGGHIEKSHSLADNKELCRIALSKRHSKLPQCSFACQPFRRPASRARNYSFSASFLKSAIALLAHRHNFCYHQ